MVTSFCCHDKPDVNIHEYAHGNFHPCLRESFFHILFNVDGDEVNAQTWEVLTLKHPIKPPHDATNGVTTVKSYIEFFCV